MFSSGFETQIKTENNVFSNHCSFSIRSPTATFKHSDMLYLGGWQDLIESHLVSHCHPLVELAHSAVGGLLHRRVVTEDQDTRLVARKTMKQTRGAFLWTVFIHLFTDLFTVLRLYSSALCLIFKSLSIWIVSNVASKSKMMPICGIFFSLQVQFTWILHLIIYPTVQEEPLTTVELEPWAWYIRIYTYILYVIYHFL